MSLILNGDYSIGDPERRPRLRTLNGDFPVMPNIPGRVLVKIGGELVICYVQVKVGGSLTGGGL